MAVLDVAFVAQETSLSVRTFSVREGMSKLFEVSIIARSEIAELDLDTFIGKGAAFNAHAGVGKGRAWNGVCSHAEQVRVEPHGLSTYYFRIMPDFWRTTQRSNARVFQQKTIPEMVVSILAEWRITVEMRLEVDYPKYEYRVQYNETDYVFVTRLLEEAGIAYHFLHAEVSESDAPKPGDHCKLVLSDAPHARAPRAGGPICFVDEPTHAGKKEHVSRVRLAHQSKAGRVTVRDFDFRTRPDYKLLAEARDNAQNEDRYEHFHYEPGAFLVVGKHAGETPCADDKGAARVDERRHGQSVAEKKLAAHRVDRRRVSFTTNCMDLAPGTVTHMSDHPRADLGVDAHLLVTESTLEGAHGSDWHVSCEASFAAVPYRPKQRTQRPKIYGVQSAIVVGPQGEEIHCDEFGRVRVQFHWDREGSFTEGSSCWIRVSHGWAGSSYGMMAIPRVGQEVLVEFFEGDPDRPVITGRVYNNTTRVPYKLPDDKTKSGWKSASSPGADGFNELMFDDKKGCELITMQAQKDLAVVVKDSETRTVAKVRSTNIGIDEAITVGMHRTANIGFDDVTMVGGNLALDVIGSRAVTIAGSDSINVGESFTLRLGEHTGVAMSEGRIVLTSGGSSVVLTETGICFDAEGDINISAGGKLVLSGQDVAIDGGPLLKLNCGCLTPPCVATLAAALAPCGPDEVILEGEIIEAAIVLEGQGQWVFPGELCESVSAAPVFVEIEGLGGTCERETIIVKEKVVRTIEIVDIEVDHFTLEEVVVIIIELLGIEESKRLCAAIDKYKLYCGLAKHHTLKDIMVACPKIFGPKLGKRIAIDIHTVVVVSVIIKQNNISHHCKIIGSCGGHPHDGGGMNGCGHVSVFGGGHHPGNGHPGNGHPGNGHPGNGHPGNGHPGNGHPGNGHPGNGHPGNGHSGTGTPSQPVDSSHPQPTQGQPSHPTHGGQPVHGQPSQPTHGQPGHGQPSQPTHGQPGHGQPSQPTHGQPVHVQPSQPLHAGHLSNPTHAGPPSQSQPGHQGHPGHGVQAQPGTGNHGSQPSQSGQTHNGTSTSSQVDHPIHSGKPSHATVLQGNEAQRAAGHSAATATPHPVAAVHMAPLDASSHGAAVHAAEGHGQGHQGGHHGRDLAHGQSQMHAQGHDQAQGHGQAQGQAHASNMAQSTRVAPATGAAAAHAATLPPNKQYMTMKTSQTPYHVDESQVHAHTQRYMAAGHTPEQAHAKALKHQGVALYEGDGAGHFKKLPA